MTANTPARAKIPLAGETKSAPQFSRSAFLVLGMHRSGTSLLTGILHRLGAAPPKNLMQPDQNNLKGYSESWKFGLVHERMLASAGTYWSDWSPFNADWAESPAAEPFEQELAALFQEEFGDAALSALKDPRICRFAGFWLTLLEKRGIRPLPVIPVRNPLEVAASLHRRDAMPVSHGVLLWLRHVVDAEHATRGRPRVFVNHQDVLQDWRGVAESIRAKLGIRWPRMSRSAELEIDAWVDRDLHHEVSSDSATLTRRDIAEWVRRAYALLLDVSKNGESQAAHRAFDDIRNAFDNASAVFGVMMREYELKSAAGAAEVKKASDSAALAEDRAKSAEGRAGVAEGRASALSAELAHAAAQARRAETQAADLSRDLSSAVERADAAEAQIGMLVQNVTAAMEKANVAEARINVLMDDLAIAVQKRGDAEAQVAALGFDLAAAAERAKTADAKSEALLAELAAAVQKAQAAEDSLAALTQHVATIQARAAALEAEASAAAESASAANMRIDALTRDLTAAAEAVREAGATLNARAAELSVQQKRAEALDTRIAQTVHDLHRTQAELDAARELVRTREVELAAMKDVSNSAIASRDAEIARLSQAFADAQAGVAASDMRIKSLTHQHAAALEALAHPKGDESSRAALEADIARLEDVRRHEAQVSEALTSQCADLEKALKSARERIALLEASVETLRTSRRADTAGDPGDGGGVARDGEKLNENELPPRPTASAGMLQRLLDDHARFTSAGPEFEDFDPKLLRGSQNADVKPLLLAYYLPQFHPIEENDAFWGAGFTEWRQLPRAVSRFPGHYQPRIPRDLGFYDLRDVDAVRRQAELALAAGVGGFCFYYYWFNGRRVLHKPLELLMSSDIEMPFALMWANENWTRAWDGGDTEVLLRQDYLPEDEDALLADFVRHFTDRRYIRIDGRPLFIIYNPRSIPDSAATIARWRERLEREHGLKPLIYMAQTFGVNDPRPFGLDGAIEFPPHKLSQNSPGRPTPESYSAEFASRVIEYDDFVNVSLEEETPEYPLIKTIVPSWDNDPRKPNRGLLLEGLSPKKYEDWLKALLLKSMERPVHGAAIVAINAWNEWAESAYLEPDVYYGSAYLNATARAYSAAVSEFDVCRRNSVSVIVPNYNHARFLEERLRSILDQSVSPAEIIFLDDASTDDSLEVARRVLAASPIPYRIVANDKNSGGVFRQWIKGLELAQSELVWIAESDDTVDKDFLRHLSPEFEREDVMAAFGRISYVTEEGAPLNELDGYYDGLDLFSWDESRTVTAHEAFARDFAIKNVIPNASGLVFRKPRLTEREIERLYEYRFAGDWYFYALIARGGSIAYNKDARSFFRQRRTSTSREAFFSDRHLAEHRMILADLRQEHGVSDRTVREHATQLAKLFPDRAPEEVLQAVAPSSVSLRERPLRVCIAAHSFAVGGGEVVPVLMANALRARGHHVTYLVLERLPADARNIRSRLRPDIPIIFWEDVTDPAGFVASHGFDIFNSHNVSWEWRLACDHLDLKTPYVATLHGGYETVANLLDQAFFVEHLKKTVGAWLYLADKNFDLLTARGIPARLFRQTFNAIPDYQGVWVDRPSFRKHHNIPEDAFVLVQCSRAIEEKGWKTAIETVRLASRKATRPVHLVLMGDGPYLETARQLAQDMNNVTFLGQVDEPLRYLRCFDLGIFPSTFSGESFPLFLLECFHAGLPVAASAIGEIPGIMGSDPPGAVFPREPGERMAARMTEFVLRVSGDRELYGRLCTIARTTSRQFSIEKLADDYMETFRALIEKAEHHGAREPAPNGLSSVTVST